MSMYVFITKYVDRCIMERRTLQRTSMYLTDLILYAFGYVYLCLARDQNLDHVSRLLHLLLSFIMRIFI